MSIESERDRLQKQLTRCRGLLNVYQSLGGVGAFGAMMIASKLEAGDKAILSGSEPWMKNAADELAGCE